MNRRTLLSALLLSAAGAGCASAPGPAAASGGKTAEADALVTRFAAETKLADFSVLVMRRETTLYERYRGAYGPATVINIASSSKWMAGALVMSLVDEGRLKLDAPVSAYVSGLPADYAALRLDQLMSYTAGLPSLKEFIELKQSPDISLAESARQAAEHALVAPPGTRFDYGGPNLQFLGAAVEAVTGQSWHEAFRQRISGPLGMASTSWGRMRQPPSASAPVRNPVLQGGVWTTQPDYAAFLTMMAQGGVLKGRRVLSTEAVAAMEVIKTRGLEKGFMPPDAAGKGGGPEYMIAHWCEAPGEGGCILSSSPGLFGVDPWIDHRDGLHGLIFLKDNRQRIAAAEHQLRAGLIGLYR